VESVVAIAKRLNPTVAAASLDFDAAVHKTERPGCWRIQLLFSKLGTSIGLASDSDALALSRKSNSGVNTALSVVFAQADADAAKFQGRATVYPNLNRSRSFAAHGPRYNAGL